MTDDTLNDAIADERRPTRGRYRRDEHAGPPSLNSSTAHLLVNYSPLHAWDAHPRLGGRAREQTELMANGTLLHALVLEDANHHLAVIDAPDFRTKAAQTARDTALAAGLTPIIKHKFEQAMETADCIRDRIFQLGYDINRGETEAIRRWTEDDIHCRMCADKLLLTEDAALILDLKFSESANPRDFGAKCVRMGYDIQRAVYLSGIEHSHPGVAGRASWVWLICETSPPYVVSAIEADGELAELGRRKWERAKATWKRCLAIDEWPGYSTDVVRLAPPGWAMAAEDEAGL